MCRNFVYSRIHYVISLDEALNFQNAKDLCKNQSNGKIAGIDTERLAFKLINAIIQRFRGKHII